VGATDIYYQDAACFWLCVEFFHKRSSSKVLRRYNS
jgi:hypothetical protein